MRPIQRIVFVLGILLATTVTPGCGSVAELFFPSLGDGWLRAEVMTRNVYYGTNLAPVREAILADDFPAAVEAVGEVHAQLLATDFPARARGFADELAARDGGAGPAVVGLQEVALWRRQAPGDVVAGNLVAASEVYVDQLAILLDALRARGLRYDVVAVQEGLDAELPYFDEAFGFVDLRITDRDVLLVRADVARTGAQGAQFLARLAYANGLEIPTSWVACDLVTARGPVRVVSAHLEADDPEIRAAQVAELLAGPAAVEGPVILLGDLNAELRAEGGDGSLEALLAAGFVDGWSSAHPELPGKTFGLDEDLVDPAASASQRLDYILVRAGRAVDGGVGITVGASEITGLELEDRVIASDGRLLWRSDHGGLCASIRVE